MVAQTFNTDDFSEIPGQNNGPITMSEIDPLH
jgi:hypothetical protein